MHLSCYFNDMVTSDVKIYISYQEFSHTEWINTLAEFAIQNVGKYFKHLFKPWIQGNDEKSSINQYTSFSQGFFAARVGIERINESYIDDFVSENKY